MGTKPETSGKQHWCVKRACGRASRTLSGFAEMQVVSFADLYGGKIVAALDRQHPLSHRRPMAEVLAVRPKDIAAEFERGFAGTTDEPVTLDELIAARDQIKAVIAGAMPAAHRRLLLSVEAGEPDWPHLGIEGVAELPSVRWRLQNICSLDAARRAENIAQLGDVLGESV